MSTKKIPQTEFTDLQKDVIAFANKVNKVLVTGSIFFIALILFKLGIIQFNLYGIKAPIENAWLIALLFTVAHFWTGIILLASAAHNLWKTGSLEQGNQVFYEVTRSGSSFVTRLIPRTEYTRTKFVTFYRMSFHDPSTWVALGAAMLLLIAIVPWDFSDPSRFLLIAVVALLTISLNWLIGGIWIIALSGLTVARENARYHLDIDLKLGGKSVHPFHVALCYPHFEQSSGQGSAHRKDDLAMHIESSQGRKKRVPPEHTS